jgi:hypothetical protein
MSKTPRKPAKPAPRPALPSGGGSWTRTPDGGLKPAAAPDAPAPTPNTAPAEPAGETED